MFSSFFYIYIFKTDHQIHSCSLSDQPLNQIFILKHSNFCYKVSGEDTTSNKEKKTLNIQKEEHSKLKDFSVCTFNTHISTSKKNKIISKVFNGIDL